MSRNEPNRVVVDQSGSGSAGTFSVDVTGSITNSDKASGNGTSTSTTVTSSGNAAEQSPWHLVMTGNYTAAGSDPAVFSITKATYTETGTYSSSRDVSRTNTNGGGTTVGGTRSGNYSLDWTAERINGSLAYTVYAYTASETSYLRSRSDYGGGYYDQVIYDAPLTVSTTLSNGVATSISTGTSTESHTGRLYDPDNAPSYARDYAYSSSTPPPAASTVNLGAPPVPTAADWVWRADGRSATNFTFHGVAVANSSVNETATFRTPTGGQTRLDIDSFTSKYLGSDSGHVVEDVPGTFGTGTDLFHRDQTFNGGNSVTGKGSHVNGVRNADFDAEETGDFTANNKYTASGDHSYGVDDDGYSFDLLFNFARASTAGGESTHTHAYHDGTAGLSLTGAVYAGSGYSSVESTSSGTRNGTGFSGTSTVPESYSGSVIVPGNTGRVGIADGMKDDAPRALYSANLGLKFIGEVDMPTPRLSALPGKFGNPQNWYNQKVIEIGQQAEKIVVNLMLRKQVYQAITENLQDGKNPKGSGVMTMAGGPFIVGHGLDDKQAKKERAMIATKEGPKGWDPGKTFARTEVEITYVVDMSPTNDPLKTRSGNVVAAYKVKTTYTGKKGGVAVSTVDLATLTGSILFHDEKYENMSGLTP